MCIYAYYANKNTSSIRSLFGSNRWFAVPERLCAHKFMAQNLELSPGLEVVVSAQGAGLVTGSILPAGGPASSLAVAVAPEAIETLTPRGRLRAADVEFGVLHLPASAVHPNTPQSIDILRQQHGVGNVSVRLPALNHQLAVDALNLAAAQGFVSPDEGPRVPRRLFLGTDSRYVWRIWA